MAFLNTLRQAPIVQRAAQLGQQIGGFIPSFKGKAVQDRLTQVQGDIVRRASEALPLLTGGGAALVGLPFGLAPLGGFAGYGAGRAVQGQLLPGSTGPLSGQEPYNTLGRASLMGLGSGALQSVLGPQPAPITPLNRPAPMESLEARQQNIQQMLSRQRASPSTLNPDVIESFAQRSPQMGNLAAQSGTGRIAPGLQRQFEIAFNAGDWALAKRIAMQVLNPDLREPLLNLLK